MPTITQLTYIVSVDKHRHFARAAEECHVSQPSLSAQIQKAEDELGVIIFDRSKKPVLVTDMGKKIVDQARVILREHKKLQGLQLDPNHISGEFRLGVIPTLAPYVIPLFIESFSRQYPDVHLTVLESKTEDIIKQLADDEIDGGLLVTPLQDDRIIERVLFYEPFYVYASENHELKSRKIIKDTDLDASSVWLLDEGHCFRDQVIRVCSLDRRNQVLDNVTFASGNLETLIQLVKRGRGYTLLPYLATLDLSEGDKAKHLKKFASPAPTREVSLVHSRSFLKQEILDAIEKSVILNIPKELKSLKRDRLEVIDI